MAAPPNQFHNYNASTELPLGWAQMQDQNGIYYFNVNTAERQRRRPTKTAQSASPVNDWEDDLPLGWVQLGYGNEVYYMNVITEQKQTRRPTTAAMDSIDSVVIPKIRTEYDYADLSSDDDHIPHQSRPRSVPIGQKHNQKQHKHVQINMSKSNPSDLTDEEDEPMPTLSKSNGTIAFQDILKLQDVTMKEQLSDKVCFKLREYPHKL